MSNRSLFAVLATFVLVFLCACVAIGGLVYLSVAPAGTAGLPSILGMQPTAVLPAQAEPTSAPVEVEPTFTPGPTATPIERDGPAEDDQADEPQLTPVLPTAPSEPQPTTPPEDIPTPGPTATPLPVGELAALQAEERAIYNVYQRVGPSVVNITVAGAEDNPLSGGIGSGFVWDKEGHIVTNNHVVEAGPQILVAFSDLTEVEAEVVGTDPQSDLAVIKVDVPADVLQPVEMGVSSELFVGQRVIAIGNPFQFERTVTAGIVSAVGRAIPQITPFSLPNLIQTDAAINPGNSGGPLLDIQGRVIGVNTLIFSQTPRANSGVGFAIPSDTVSAVVPSLIESGVYEHPYIGISASSLTPSVARACEIEGIDRGVLVQEVLEGTPAEEAGLRGGTEACQVQGLPVDIQVGGDVIVGIDQVEVESFEDLINYLDTKRVGDTVTLRVFREGETLEVDVTVIARPDLDELELEQQP